MVQALLNKSVLSNVALGLAGVAVVSTMVVRSSTAAFTDSTDTSGSWDAGTVSLTDVASATFAVTGAVPGDSGSECVDVIYDGSADVGQSVKLYTSALTDSDGSGTGTLTAAGLSDNLRVTVSVYVAGESCATASPTSVAPVYATAPIADVGDTLAAAIDSGWTPNPETGTDTTRAFKIDWELPSDTPNDAQGDGVDTTFTWHVQSNA